MLGFFTKKDFWGNGLSVWILAGLLFLFPFVITALKKTEMDNEVEAWLPAGDPQSVLLGWYGENFPIKDRMFLSWQGSSLNDPRVELFAARLEGYVDQKNIERRGSPYIQEVTTPRESLTQIVSQKISQEQGIESLSGLLVGHGPLKVRLTDAGRKHQSEIEKRVSELSNKHAGIALEVLPAFADWQAPPEFAEFAHIRQKKQVVLAGEGEEFAEEEDPLAHWHSAPHDFQVIWHLAKIESLLTTQVKTFIESIKIDGVSEPLVEATFFEAGSPISMVVTLSEAGVADRTAALEDVFRIAEECFIPADSIHMGGRPVGSEALNKEVKKASFDPDGPWYAKSVMGLSALASFALAFFMVRSVRLGLMILVISLYATLVTVALVPLTGRTMNMVLIVMPTFLSVLALSGSIHLSSYWKHAAQHNPKTAVSEAVRMATEPCFLALVTTAIGLGSLLTSTLNPVRDFGTYSAIGCGVALFFILVVLPSLMQLWPGTVRKERESDGKTWILLGRFLVRNHRLVVFTWMGMFAVGLYGLTFFKTETKIVRSFPEDSRLIADYWFLEDNAVGINTVDTIIRFNKQSQTDMDFLQRMEIVRQITQKLRKHEEITGAVSLADFQASQTKPAANARFLEKVAYNKRSNELESRMKSGEIEAAKSFFTVMGRDTDWFKPGDRLLGEKGDELWRISSQAYVMADNDYKLLMEQLDEISESVLVAHPGTSHSVTGMVPVFLRTQEALLQSLIWSFGVSFLLVTVMMIVLVRNVTAGILSMLPNVIPVVFCFGVMSLMGISVDIGTMITASVGLALAVDGTIHLLTWFKVGIREGLSRDEAIERGLAHCANALFQTGTIVSIGMLMLAPSSLLLISRFGTLMAALVMAALLADIILLPAQLKGWLGDIIEKGELKRQKTSVSSGDTLSPEAVSVLTEVEEVITGAVHAEAEPELAQGSVVSAPHHILKPVPTNGLEAS